VEFGNRLINAFVSVASVAALVAALRRSPRRRDLTLLSAGLVAGLVAEIVLGALVVYFKLAPGLVMVHFLLGLVVLADAVVLYQRAGLPEPDKRLGPKPVDLVGNTQLALSRLTLVALAVVAALGSIVTSSGPHGGDPKARRFDFSLHSVARLHGTSVEVFLALVVILLWSLARTEAPPIVIRRAQILLGSLIFQAVIGYTQYFNRDPVGLVAAHVAGACLVVIAALQFHLGLRAYPARTARSGPASPPTPTSVPISPLSGSR
jgi:cytochrome c oxidase assembly protein subunit 15